MEKLTQFVTEHIDDDTARLILNRAKWPEIDMDLAVNCIESRRKLRGKVQEWAECPGLVFPRKLSAEQCSSSATGAYKAEVAEVISDMKFRIADLTGGLGVDSWFFSKKAEAVMYCEMLPELCRAAEHNFRKLGAGNITVRNVAVTSGMEISCYNGEEMAGDGMPRKEEKSIFRTPKEILAGFAPDIVYMDPARRGEGGRKVFLIEECTPDVLTLKDEIFEICRHILVKLSPMADINMVCERLGRCCREVHVVAAGGECKELLVWMDREWDEEYMIRAVEIGRDGAMAVFSFLGSEERSFAPLRMTGEELRMTDEALRMTEEGAYLFEPGKALMKAGAFNLTGKRFGLCKLGKSTHYYTFNSEESVEQLKKFGKVFRIIRCSPLDKRSLKAAGKEYPHSEITARNISMDTETLRKKTGITSGDDAHIFGLKSDREGALLLITRPV